MTHFICTRSGSMSRRFRPRLGQRLVVVVVFMLHARRQRHHGQVVGVGNGVDVAGEANRERRERDALRQAAAGGRALDVEGGPAAGLAEGAHHRLAEPAQSLHQAHGGRRLAFAQRRGRDGRDVDVLGPLHTAKPAHHTAIVNLGQITPHGYEFVIMEAQLSRNLGDGLHRGLCGLGNLPIFHFGRIENHFMLQTPPSRRPGAY